MEKISNFLVNHPEVVKVDLCYNNIGDEGIETFVKIYLSRSNNLVHLNLASNDITWQGMEYLCSASDTIKLKTLRINGNKLGTQVIIYFK